MARRAGTRSARKPGRGRFGVAFVEPGDLVGGRVAEQHVAAAPRQRNHHPLQPLLILGAEAPRGVAGEVGGAAQRRVRRIEVDEVAGRGDLERRLERAPDQPEARRCTAPSATRASLSRSAIFGRS